MGCVFSCCCSKVLDESFNVGLGPAEAKAFLLGHANWLNIIPGADSAIIEEDGDTWSVKSKLTYTFSNTDATSNNALTYSVAVKGGACSPVHFTFDVAYTFHDYGDGGATIRRKVSSLHLKRCCLLHGTIKNNLRKGCQKENRKMEELMAS